MLPITFEERSLSLMLGIRDRVPLRRRIMPFAEYFLFSLHLYLQGAGCLTG